MRASPDIVCPTHISIGMRVSHSRITRDACVPAHISLMYVCPHDGLYGQFNYAVLLLPYVYFVNTCTFSKSTDTRSQNNKHCG